MFNMDALLEKWFHPNRIQQEHILTRIKELQELSSIALEIENHQIYKNLQTEQNELFLKYLMYAFFDGLRFILPHMFLLGLISRQINTISLPVALPLIGDQVGILFAYLVMAILFHIVIRRYKSYKIQLSKLANREV